MMAKILQLNFKFSVKQFDVMDGVTAVTRGPV